MKKLAIYLGIIVLLLIAVFAINQATANNIYGIPTGKLSPETRELLDDPNYQKIIVPDDLEAKIRNKEDFFVYFFSSTCPYCRATTPVIMPIAEELGIELHQFNLLEFSTGWRDYNIESTPTLVYFKEGREADRLVGGIKMGGSDAGHDPETYRQFFEKNNGK
jgi:thiol-disulfide isomerase/thioredoxin